MQFKVSARRNKYLGQWVSQILGYNSDQEKEYIQSVIKADFEEAGDEDVFRKVKADLKNHIFQMKKSEKKWMSLMKKLNLNLFNLILLILFLNISFSNSSELKSIYGKVEVIDGEKK